MVRRICADLADAPSLHGSCEGVDVLVHCASHIGGPDHVAEAVNSHGTHALVDEAIRCGVRRIVYLSTTAVSGRGVYRAADPAGLPVRPSSTTSRTRAEAEKTVLRAGGTVIRPHLVRGTGDRWVLPGLTRLHRRLRCTVDGWTALHSVIRVQDLARAVVAAALAPQDMSGIWAASHPEPVLCCDLFRRLIPDFTAVPPEEDIDLGEARSRLSDDAHSPTDCRHRTELAVDTPGMAANLGRPQPHRVSHSDRGPEYTSTQLNQKIVSWMPDRAWTGPGSASLCGPVPGHDGSWELGAQGKDSYER